MSQEQVVRIFQCRERCALPSNDSISALLTAVALFEHEPLKPETAHHFIISSLFLSILQACLLTKDLDIAIPSRMSQSPVLSRSDSEIEKFRQCGLDSRVLSDNLAKILLQSLYTNPEW